jgi:hypothetical protein
MPYLLFLALPLLLALTGSAGIDANYFGDKDLQPEKVIFDLIPLDSIKPTILFEKFVYKPIIMCYSDDALNNHMRPRLCDVPKPRFDI